MMSQNPLIAQGERIPVKPEIEKKEKKNPPANAGDLGSISGGRSPGEGNGNPLWYACWKIPRTEEPGWLQSMGSQKS